MPKVKPSSSTLMDLEWARVYADRIKDELKVIARTLSDLNAHAMNPHLAKGAVLLKTQMKQASQQVGSMRKIVDQSESNWMSTIKQALARKYPGFEDRKSTSAKLAAKKTSKKRSR
jgi:flagellar biosynthesis chaperone FliJ